MFVIINNIYLFIVFAAVGRHQKHTHIFYIHLKVQCHANNFVFSVFLFACLLACMYRRRCALRWITLYLANTRDFSFVNLFTIQVSMTLRSLSEQKLNSYRGDESQLRTNLTKYNFLVELWECRRWRAAK